MREGGGRSILMCGSHGQRTPERHYEWTAHLAEQVVLADAVPVVDLDLERALGERRQLGRDLHVKERVIKLGVEVVVHDLGLSDRLVVEVDLAVRVGERERVGALEVLAVLHLDHVELVVVEVLGLADLEPDAAARRLGVEPECLRVAVREPEHADQLQRRERDLAEKVVLREPVVVEDVDAQDRQPRVCVARRPQVALERGALDPARHLGLERQHERLGRPDGVER